MKELQYEPIGKVKMSRSQYWEDQAAKLKNLVFVSGTTMLILGVICGYFAGTMI